MKQILWGSHTTYEIQEIIEKENPIVIVSVGAMEQHGTHLTLNTDAEIGFQISKHIAESSPIRTLVVPSIWAGFSPHHMDFSGTISLRQSTLFAITYDIIESLIKHGVTRILLVNSHGGNTALLKTVVDEIGVNHGLSPIYVTYWNLISDAVKDIRESGLGGISHACELETSLKLLFSKEDVRLSEIKDVMLTGNDFFNNDMFASNKIGFYKPFKKWTKYGQIGAPSLATKEKGEQLLEAIVKEFINLIKTEWGSEIKDENK